MHNELHNTCILLYLCPVSVLIKNTNLQRWDYMRCHSLYYNANIMVSGKPWLSHYYDTNITYTAEFMLIMRIYLYSSVRYAREIARTLNTIKTAMLNVKKANAFSILLLN